MKWIVSAFADEAADSLIEQIEALQEAGIFHLEIRGVDGQNIGKITPQQAKEIRKRLDDGGIAVSSIGSPFGKIKVTEHFAPHFDEFQAGLEVAHILGAKTIRMFSFFTDGRPHPECKDTVLERLEKFLTAAKGSGVLLCHENEKGIYGDTAAHCLELHEVFGHRLGGVFDPANYLQCGDSTLEAHRLVKPYITYYHVKDVSLDTGAIVPAGEGDGQIVELLRQLREQPGETFVTLEPHLQAFSGLAQLEHDGGASIKHKYRFANNRESFAFAAEALKKSLAEAGYTEKNGLWEYNPTIRE